MALPPADVALAALDPRALAGLRRAAKENADASRAGIAREFESLFLAMMLKSMRATAGEGSAFDSESTRLYRELADQQMARALATQGRGLGLADMLLTQMNRPAVTAPTPSNDPIALHRPPRAHALARDAQALPLKVELPGSDATPVGRGLPSPASTPREFVSTIWPHAVAAGQALGVPPAFVVAHAALESGWGQRAIQLPDGRPSHNLFGIKAGPDWQGPTVDITTTEYLNGMPQRRLARFRAYASYEEAFADYARLLKQSGRYEQVVAAADFPTFAGALQRAGYATDPAYADKLGRVFASRVFREAMAA